MPPDVVARALALASEAATAISPAQARVTAQAGNLDPRLTLAPCGRIDAYLPAGLPAWGATRVGLRCSDGRVRWNVTLPVTIQVWAPAVVSLGALPAGARLTEGQLGHAEIDWAAASSPPFEQTATVAGRTLARPVDRGQPLRASDLQARLWFAQGDIVRIVAAGSGYAVSSEGQALSPGYEGQPARVRTDSGRVLIGRPVGDHSMEVSL
jgi:flagella basal body P-ring formation protein FlgA